MLHTYEVSGMRCQSCVGKVVAALKAVPGVSDATVTLRPPRAEIRMEHHVSTEILEKALRGAGEYSLSEIVASSKTAEAKSEPKEPQSLTPLFVILSYIVGGVVLRAIISNDFSPHSLMTNFMGGFFVVFSLFKMINLSGFADGYSTYDVLAKRSRVYALAYPFIELALGIAYLTAFAPVLTNLVTLALMVVGSMGVAQALREKRTIQCACLGTALKLPMTKVTLAEDVVMGLMALVMLAI
jgi:copper chaperone CopZ